MGLWYWFRVYKRSEKLCLLHLFDIFLNILNVFIQVKTVNRMEHITKKILKNMSNQHNEQLNIITSIKKTQMTIKI